MTPDSAATSRSIKKTALELGFSACGIAPAVALEKETAHFKKWLRNHYHASMEYMDRNVEKRLNPKKLEPWATSVIVCLYNYFPGEQHALSSNYKISKYARGRDYHKVIKDKLHALKNEIGQINSEMRSRVFVDSAPVLERAWAVRAGLGWTGKNACLINKAKGSFFFIGIILTDLELTYDNTFTDDLCGNCTRCIEACPNGAIISAGTIDANKCISYLTIEHKGDFNKPEQQQLHGWIFGCDVCQDVCPWNRFSVPHQEPAFKPGPELLKMTDKDWETLDERGFIELFGNTAVERTGYDALRRNIEQGLKNKE